MVLKIIDIVGVALILGLILRYSTEAAQLVQQGGQTATSFYKAVSLQDISRNNS